VTVATVAAVVIAWLQFRDDTTAARSTHWVVWATIAIGAVWLGYALLVGAVLVLGRLFCLSDVCRGPLGSPT
jgi:hypothetical protein